MESASTSTAGVQPTAKSWAGSLPWAVAALSILVALASVVIAIQRAVLSGDFRAIVSHQSLTPFITIGFAVIGALVSTHHPRNPIGWIFVTVGQLYAYTALAAALLAYGPAFPLYDWVDWFGSWLWLPAVLLPVTFVLLVFPDGHLPSPGWRWVAWSAAFGLALAVLYIMFYPGALSDWGLEANPFGIPGAGPILDKVKFFAMVFLAVGVIGSLAAYVVRYRRSTGIEREQLKWLGYALGIYILLSVLISLAWLIWPDFSWQQEINIVGQDLGILGIAAAAAIAILRHRLYEIDLIVNRTLVYTALMVGVAALYGLAIGGLGVFFQESGNFTGSLMATGLAAILVQPMRDRLQQLVNRLMYGERDDPYAVLSKLSQRLEGALSPDATLPTIVESIAQALKLPYVAIALKQEGGYKMAAIYGKEQADWIPIPLRYQGNTVGQLRLAPRAPDEPFTPGEQRLLEDIAHQAGVAVHAIRLTLDLHRSREALVLSREEERRRLRRDLHDELGPQLASLKLNIGVARKLVSGDPDAAVALLADLSAQTQAAIVDIRRLVHNLRPPALDELGLISAIYEYTRQIESQDGLRIRLIEPGELPPLPAAVEVAAYRIALEALANVVRHSQAKNCSVSLAIQAQTLQVEVRDDGLGLPEEIQPGVGLYSMRERAEELGGTCEIESPPQGGTRVMARLPLG